ncbi:unnamed protein product [Rotaria magnacalcarata]|uniref:VWFA domain-containing protein n=3 Tax=Rotaria magnacalcarata TaxID=392030 RepID=A0A815ZCY2_9BILA|nr:unnamed protein product [Rotaria magnacalcarata]
MTSNTDRASFSGSSTALLAIPYAVTPGESRNFDLTTSSYAGSNGPNADPAYLFSQIRSTEWIHRYGLKSQRLTFDQILQQIGFKRVESFDPVIGKTVTAKYAGNLYHEVQHDNGDRYVLTCRPDKLREFHHRLTRMLSLLRKRVLFITDGSRRLFGVISEPTVCLVCDCKTLDHRIFNQFQVSLTNLFKEQISKIKKFNVIWVSNDNEQFREQPIDVNATNIDQAIDWICDRKCPRNKISIGSTCEAVLKGFDNSVESVYLISEGDSSDLAREMLRDNIVKTRLSSTSPKPLHVVSLYCHNNDTQLFLRSLAQSAEGSYFCYKIKNEVANLKAPSNLNDPTRIKLQGDKLQMGTNALAPLPEYPLDITLMYKEIVECQNVIDRLEKILGFIRDENQSPAKSIETTKSMDAFSTSGDHNFQRSLVVQSSALFSNQENEMSSADWLKIHGIDAQKLDFFSVLQSAAFRHCDGVVTLLKPPADSREITASAPANFQEKLINAIYCDQFAHVTWPDGTIRHVHVTPELYRDYERRMKTLLEKLKARLAWLKKGSRDVFGSILENNIYILIDTSQSMQHHLSFVKEKLRLLIQDQLHTKERVNLVAFNSAITPWRDRLTKINDTTTYSQLQPWIDGLNAEGSTNTLAALRFALADPTTEAIYLLTDGRPDQNERHILSQVQYRQTVPIHTIAFNCNDQAANRFLIDLAKQTGGRFHTFSCGFEKQAAIEIPESEDVGGVKNELIRGEKELERIAGLRDECLGIAWSQENLRGKFPKSKSQRIHNDDKPIPSQRRSQSTLDLPFRPNTASMPLRTTKKKRSITNKNRQRRSKSATNLTAHSAVINYNNDQWLLPETKEYLKVSNETEETKSDTENQDKVEIERPKRKPIRTPYNEVISYLKRKSLVVQGLTIFDVLYPTSVTVKDPHHIQVIDRYVLAKVWDDILPLTYGSYVGKLRLVNHYAVDLEKYEVKLKELIDNYHKFTTDFIWKHLSDDDKRKLGPSIHWDSLSKDEQNKITQEIRTEEYTSQNSLENFAWRKLTEQEQNALLQKPVPYQDKNQTLVKAALKEAEAESALKGIARMDVEIHRAIKFLQISTDLRQLQKRADADAKPAVEQKPKIKPKSAQHNFHQRVICRFDADGFFHPGTIQKNPDGRAMIRFDIGIEQEAVGHIMLPTNGAIAQPHLYVNDCVLVRRINGTQEYWAPGVVAVLPSPTAQPPPLYMVQVYAPSLSAVHVHRRDILKISLGLYQRTVSYLQSINRKPEPPTDSIPKIPDESSFKDVLRRELEPLTTKVEHIHKSNKIRYRQLKAVLEDQMNVINDLQEKTSNKVARLKRAAPVSISLIPDHDEPDPPKSISSRRSSVDSSIQPNTQVFALWLEDDSFVYEGIILNKLSHSNSYTVKRTGLHGVESIISRENIFLQTDLICLKTLHSPSFALIEYPKNGRNCWKPAAILPSDDKETQKSVRFYDGMDVAISNSKHVIPIDRNKFQEYAQYRIDFEKSLIGQVIVGLNQEEKKFMLGTVIDRVAHGHTYTIQWCDKNQSEQDEEYLYGAFTRSIRHQINDTVLAMDDNQCLYKLARVIHILRDKKKLIVRFIDAEEDNREIEVPAATTFVITTPAFESIIEKQKTT